MEQSQTQRWYVLDLLIAGHPLDQERFVAELFDTRLVRLGGS